MCAVRISLLPVSSCSCSQEEIRSLGIAEPVSLKIISATVLALLGCSTEPRYSGFHAQCIRSRFRADDGRTRCTAAGIYQSFGNIRKARSEMAGFLLVGGNIGGKNRDKQLFQSIFRSDKRKKPYFDNKIRLKTGGEGGIRPPAGGPPRVARRPRRLAKCPRFESLQPPAPCQVPSVRIPPCCENKHPPPVGEGCLFLEKVSRFDRKTIKGVHRLFRGVHFNLGGCKWQRGCILNDWVR